MTNMDKSQYPDKENGEVTSSSNSFISSVSVSGDGGGSGIISTANQQQWLYPNAMTIRDGGGPPPPPMLQTNASNIVNDNSSEIAAAVCAGCNLRIMDKFYLNALDSKWHTSCLKCSECGMELESQISCYERDGLILCREDYLR